MDLSEPEQNPSSILLNFLIFSCYKKLRPQTGNLHHGESTSFHLLTTPETVKVDVEIQKASVTMTTEFKINMLNFLFSS